MAHSQTAQCKDWTCLICLASSLSHVSCLDWFVFYNYRDDDLTIMDDATNYIPGNACWRHLSFQKKSFQERMLKIYFVLSIMRLGLAVPQYGGSSHSQGSNHLKQKLRFYKKKHFLPSCSSSGPTGPNMLDRAANHVGDTICGSNYSGVQTCN